jgi:hypothetical protein
VARGDARDPRDPALGIRDSRRTFEKPAGAGSREPLGIDGPSRDERVGADRARRYRE